MCVHRSSQTLCIGSNNLCTTFCTQKRISICVFIAFGNNNSILILFQTVEDTGIAAGGLSQVSSSVIICSRKDLISVPDIPTVTVATRNVCTTTVRGIAIFRHNVGYALGVIFISENSLGIAAIRNNKFTVQTGISFGQGITL